MIPLIYFHSIDDFDEARARHAVEDEWYRVHGEEDWRAERQAHVAFAEFRAGRWDEAERLVEEACAVIARVEQPGPWTMAFRIRADRRRGPRSGRASAGDTRAADRAGTGLGAHLVGSAAAVRARIRRVHGRRPRGRRPDADAHARVSESERSARDAPGSQRAAPHRVARRARRAGAGARGARAARRPRPGLPSPLDHCNVCRVLGRSCSGRRGTSVRR